ncbi:MAG: GTP-binding protein [Kiritimatiellales bacterium]|jgi:G3E family GTPase
MKLIVISGFLGSGKTTLLLTLAKTFSEQGHKVAIIENEVGKTGVDGEMLKAEGLSVREIYSGCVCCSLRHDLIHTLLELEREVQPDIVFLEPSGVAGPKQIQHCLCGYSGEIEKTVMIAVADAQRLPAIRDFSIPLVHDGIEIADLVAINKADLVSPEQLGELQQRLLEVNPSAEIFCISAQQGTNVDQLTGKITALIAQGETEKPAVELSAENDLPKAAIFASSVTVESPNAGAIKLIEQFLQQLGRQLKPVDGILIGHLKAIVKTEPTGYAVFSVTNHDQPPVQKGRLPDGPVERFTLTVNAIIYGMSEGPFKRLCLARFRTLETELRGK